MVTAIKPCRFRCWDDDGNSTPVHEIEAATADEAARTLMSQWCEDAPDIESATIAVHDGSKCRVFACTSTGSVTETGDIGVIQSPYPH